MLYLSFGLLAWLPARFIKSAVTVLVGVLGLMAVTTVSTAIARAYLPSAPLTQSQLPVDLKPVNATLAPGVVLLGYQRDDVPVTLYWQAATPIATDYNLFLHLLARNHILVGNIDSWPGGGLRPTSFWKVGEIYPDRYLIHLDGTTTVPDFAPSQLRLDIAMWRTDSSQPFPIQSATGEAIPSITVPAGLLQPATWPIPNPAYSVETTFDGGFSLSGYSIPAGVTAGQPFMVTLYWQTSSPTPTNYTVFIHIVDQNGQSVGQGDGPPLSGDWPTSAWLPGQSITDSNAW
jgi:hypothetical protein